MSTLPYKIRKHASNVNKPPANVQPLLTEPQTKIDPILNTGLSRLKYLLPLKYCGLVYMPVWVAATFTHNSGK